MTFGVNVNHISQGLLSGAYPGLVINTKQPAIPLVYNVIDPATIVNLLNVMVLPKPKVFVGTMKFSTTPVDDSHSLQLSDPVNNFSFYYTDSILINGRSEKFITMPVIFKSIECTLTAKYSICFFGYLFEYNF